MIQYLDKEDKTAYRRMWEEIFSEDTLSFLDFYDKEIASQNRILAAVEDGKLAAMIHRNPYVVMMKGVGQTSDYIVGVATDPAKRHQGYMRRLLVHMLKDMYQEEMGFCFLMPADQRIYQPFDFVYIFDQPQYALKEEAYETLDFRECRDCREDYQMAAAWMEERLSAGYEVYTRRDEEYVRKLRAEVMSDGGNLLLFYKKEEGERGGLAGIWAFYGDKETTRELLFYPEYVREAEPARPAIMGRIVNLSRFIKAICLKESYADEAVNVILRVSDSLLPDNNGVYLWTLDHAGSSLEKITLECGAGNPDGLLELEVDIGELTAWLFGYQEIAWEGAAMVRVLNGVYLDEIV